MLVACVHLLFAHVINPAPLLRQDVLQKMEALTQEGTPRLLFAGDSRAECQLVPSLFAERLGISENEVANMAVSGGDSNMTAVAVRRFRHRIADDAVIVMSVSPHHLADRQGFDRYYSADYFWSAGLFERLKHLSIVDALKVTFIPERAFLEQLSRDLLPTPPKWEWQGRGFRPLGNDPEETSADGYAKTVSRLKRWNCFDVGDADSFPVRKFVQDIKTLQAMGLQVVLLDAPDHPVLLDSLSGSDDGRNYVHFRRLLSRLASELDVPLMTYRAADLLDVASVDNAIRNTPADRNRYEGLFVDGVHLTTHGAMRLSECVAEDLERLHAMGAIALRTGKARLAVQRPDNNSNHHLRVSVPVFVPNNLTRDSQQLLPRSSDKQAKHSSTAGG